MPAAHFLDMYIDLAHVPLKEPPIPLPWDHAEVSSGQNLELVGLRIYLFLGH